MLSLLNAIERKEAPIPCGLLDYYKFGGGLAPVDVVIGTNAKMQFVSMGSRRDLLAERANLILPVRAAIFHSRYPLF